MSVYFAAEVCSNHHRDLHRAFSFIKTAAQIGCQAVKFQLFKIRELFASEILSRSEEHRRRESWELPVEFLSALASCCRESGIHFACTPFYLRAVEELFPYVDFYKIASYELLWEDLLKLCGNTGRPVVLSTGMATLDECQKAVEILHQAGCRDLTLLHCVSGYPANPRDCNLAALETLRKACSCPVGWSDHTANPGVLFRAAHRWGASFIEFHLDLDGKGDEFPMGHCWLPEQVRPVIEGLRHGFAADGEGAKEPSRTERVERDWRADPSDGLRPLASVRDRWRG